MTSKGPSSSEILSLQRALRAVSLTAEAAWAHLVEGSSRVGEEGRSGWARAPGAMPQAEGTQEHRCHWNRVRDPGDSVALSGQSGSPRLRAADSRALGACSVSAEVLQARDGAGGTIWLLWLLCLEGGSGASVALSGLADTPSPEAGTLAPPSRPMPWSQALHQDPAPRLPHSTEHLRSCLCWADLPSRG